MTFQTLDFNLSDSPLLPDHIRRVVGVTLRHAIATMKDALSTTPEAEGWNARFTLENDPKPPSPATEDVLAWARRLAWEFRHGCDDTREHMELVVRKAADEIERLCAAAPAVLPDSVLNANARKDGATRVVLTEAQRPTADWLKSRGFVEDEFVLAYAWSSRSGMGFIDLEFFPTQRHANDAGFMAIIGSHASGENPRLQIGFCEHLPDVQLVTETIRRINGYKKPEPFRTASPDADVEAPEDPQRTLDVLARMLGWLNTPPPRIFEQEINALKARAHE